MARLAEIVEGVVVNVIVAAPDFALPGVTLVASDVAGIGWAYADGVFTPPAPVAVVAPVPVEITAGRLIQALAELDLLDAADAAVAQSDALTQRLWARAPTFRRDDPLVAAIAAALNQSSDDLDDIFRLAATK